MPFFWLSLSIRWQVRSKGIRLCALKKRKETKKNWKCVRVCIASISYLNIWKRKYGTQRTGKTGIRRAGPRWRPVDLCACRARVWLVRMWTSARTRTTKTYLFNQFSSQQTTTPSSSACAHFFATTTAEKIQKKANILFWHFLHFSPHSLGDGGDSQSHRLVMCAEDDSVENFAFFSAQWKCRTRTKKGFHFYFWASHIVRISQRYVSLYVPT